jgi:hypothetical protein
MKAMTFIYNVQLGFIDAQSMVWSMDGVYLSCFIDELVESEFLETLDD